MVTTALAGTFVMALLLLGFVYVFTEGRSRNPTVAAGRRAAGGSTSTGGATVLRMANGPMGWLVGFLLLGGVALAGTLLALGVGPEGFTELGIPIFVGVFGIAILGFILGGSFLAVTSRGYGNAMGLAVASGVFGVLLLVAIGALLLAGSL